MAEKKNKKKQAQKTPSDGNTDRAVPKPLPGCLLPGCLSVLLAGILLLYLVSASVLPVVFPGKVHPVLFEPVNWLRFHSDHFYRISEYIYYRTGGELDSFQRGDLYHKFRADLHEPDGTRILWLVDGMAAEVIQFDTDGKRIASQRLTLEGDRSECLRLTRRNGWYDETHPMPGKSLYRNGRLIRRKTHPVQMAAETVYHFDCRYRDDAPWSGTIAAEINTGNEYYRMRMLTLLRGKTVANVFFPERAYYRGLEVYGDVSGETAALLEYEFGKDRTRLHSLTLSEKNIASLIRARQAFRWENGEPGLPDSLIRMAIRKSDLILLKQLLRSDSARREFADANHNAKPGAWTALHDAAICENVQILAEVIGMFPDVHLREAVTGATPFLAAAAAGRTEHVLLFLRRGDSDVNAALKDGCTALHLAVETLSPELASLLVSYRADRRKSNRRGETPLMYLQKSSVPETDPDGKKLLLLLESR